MKRISWRLGGPHTATSCNAIYLSPCQPATVRLHHWFGQLGNQTEVGKAVESRRFSELLWHRPLIRDFIGLHLGTIGACKRCFSLPMKPCALLGFCRAKSIGFDIGPGLHLTRPKNPSMYLESLQCVKPLAAMGWSARAIQIETISSQGHWGWGSHNLSTLCCR